MLLGLISSLFVFSGKYVTVSAAATPGNFPPPFPWGFQEPYIFFQTAAPNQSADYPPRRVEQPGCIFDVFFRVRAWSSPAADRSHPLGRGPDSTFSPPACWTPPPWGSLRNSLPPTPPCRLRGGRVRVQVRGHPAAAGAAHVLALRQPLRAAVRRRGAADAGARGGGPHPAHQRGAEGGVAWPEAWRGGTRAVHGGRDFGFVVLSTAR